MLLKYLNQYSLEDAQIIRDGFKYRKDPYLKTPFSFTAKNSSSNCWMTARRWSLLAALQNHKETPFVSGRVSFRARGAKTRQVLT